MGNFVHLIRFTNFLTADLGAALGYPANAALYLVDDVLNKMDTRERKGLANSNLK